jgi:hypothetical protein
MDPILSQINPIHILILHVLNNFNIIFLSTHASSKLEYMYVHINQAVRCNWPFDVIAVEVPAQSINIRKQTVTLSLLTTKSEPTGYIVYCHMNVRGYK